jgi:hypothetical protein
VRLAAIAGWQILRHPASTEDIERDRDDKRREIVLSKLRRYLLLDHAPAPTPDFLERVGGNEGPNDRCDNHVLYSVEARAVGLLITEDQRLHRKARRVGLGDRVYYVGQALETLRALLGRKIEIPPVVEDLPLYAVPLSDHFFDSLRADYRDPPFDNWYKKSCDEGRRCWAIMKESTPEAVCIYKREEDPPVPTLPRGPWLKLCTFKVAEAVSGRKLGELLLKTAFATAIGQKLRGTYVTVFPEKHRLISLFSTFGFEAWSHKANGELIMAKSLGVPATVEPRLAEDPIAYNALYYPAFLDGPGVRKFVVPVIPEYHRLLFPDAKHIGEFWPSNAAVSNAMRKAYLCNSPSNLVRPGDLLLFYRSHDLKGVTTLGIVEQVVRSGDADEIAVFVGKRTVYSYDDIRELCSRGELLALMFKQISHAKKPIVFKAMKKLGIVRNNVESIVQISDPSFAVMKGEFPQ